mmetsp:Transcript_16308/g.40195  ORF Transcript_16308/g.40195 Transcript_16308/m.40195 type:complete len:118 (+) Transcript_16308:37-390(+)
MEHTSHVVLQNVFKGLQETHKLALKNGSKKTFALTVAEHCQEKLSEGHLKKLREDLNKRIRSLSSEKTTIIDFALEFPYFSLDERQREEYWDDGLHYTPAGYAQMGNIIHNVFVKHL